jgi:Flp pilus assembly pilin Flp
MDHISPFLMVAFALQSAARGATTMLERRVADVVRSHAEHRRDDRGQATTEYALVLLAAALVALLVIAWATAGGGAEKISRLFNRVIDSVIDKV